MGGPDLRRRPHALVLSLALITQTVLLFAFSRPEKLPPMRPLKESPARFGEWVLSSEGIMEKEVLDVLRADDVMSRVYRRSETGPPASLFVAYFKTQRTGQAPHSPKNCLPGSGWVPSASAEIAIPIEGLAEPIRINRYVVSRGEEKSVVLYWYQTPNRVIASEFAAKFYAVADSIRRHRSDTALVRVVVPVVNGDEDAATAAAAHFVQSFFVPLRRHLPG
ncbi:MAG: EpsI family protein [Bryobacterales bacterium]|nr:EpsI family protein [Bryobacterales bacterium]